MVAASIICSMTSRAMGSSVNPDASPVSAMRVLRSASFGTFSHRVTSARRGPMAVTLRPQPPIGGGGGRHAEFLLALQGSGGDGRDALSGGGVRGAGLAAARRLRLPLLSVTAADRQELNLSLAR